MSRNRLSVPYLSPQGAPHASQLRRMSRAAAAIIAIADLLNLSPIAATAGDEEDRHPNGEEITW